MDRTEMFCRFCLRHVTDTYFEPLGELCDILNALNLKVNLDISEESVVCVDCIKSLRELFSFKVICVQSEDFLIPFSNSHVNEKIDLQQVYLEIKGSKSLDDNKICRFCMCETPVNTCVDLSAMIELTLPTKYLLEFFPEMNMNLVRDPIICKTCHNCSQNHLSFTSKCMNVIESIYNYVEVEGTYAERKIDLKGVKQFMNKVIIKKEIEDGNTFKHEIQHGEVLNDASSKVDVKIESYLQIEDSQLEIKCDSIEVKPIVNSPESILDAASVESRENYDKNFVIHDCPDLQPYKCRENINSIRKRHILAHKNSNIQLDKYMNENYVFKRKQMHRCGFEGCSYETKYKSRLIIHKLIHKDSSEVVMYKCGCEGCLYETRHRNCLINHMLVHKNPSEVTMYKCEDEGCLYETKRKQDLIRHKLIHKDESEVMMYKCGFKGCSYETKHKSHLINHKLIHKDASEVIMYKCGCEGCLYETRHRNCLINHMLVHKNSSEVTMHKCEAKGCLYETKRKQDLIRHKLIHKDESEMMYKCEFEGCSYETKHKKYHIKHKLIHKDVSEVVLYKYGFEGSSCETKHKSSLINHMLIHKGLTEVKIYRCGFEGCSYETKHRGCLSGHSLIHKDRSEITMYKCGFEGCSYETKRKGCLSGHSLIHKDPSEVTMFKCGFEGCLYETKRKSHLIRHSLKHKKA